jgi:hypothetical protein
MSAQELEQNIVNNLNAAMGSGVHPTIIFTILHSKAFDIMVMMKNPPPATPPEGQPSPIIHLPPGR